MQYKKHYWTLEEIQNYVDRAVVQVDIEWKEAREATKDGERVYRHMKKSK